MMKLALILALLLAGALLRVSGEVEWVNEHTHCHADGWPCATTCDPTDPSYQAPYAEDDACWLIVSSNSDYPIPSYLKLLGVRDYR